MQSSVLPPQPATPNVIQVPHATQEVSDEPDIGAHRSESAQAGHGAMTWGDPSGKARFTPAKLAYGGPLTRDAEKEAFDKAIAAGVNLFDTAALYGAGASERRLGELAVGKDVVIATKFPSSFMGRVGSFPEALQGSLERLGRDAIDLYQHHFPSKRVPTRGLMRFMADAVQAGKIKAVGVSNYSAEQMRVAHAELAKRGIPLASNQVQYSCCTGSRRWTASWTPAMSLVSP